MTMRKQTRNQIYGAAKVVLGFCEASGKPQFPSRRVAKKAARDGRGRTDGRILHEYRCDTCGHWHLSSQGATR